MFLKCSTLALLGLFITKVALAADAKPQKLVEEYLSDLKAPNPQVTVITDDAITRSLPGYTCFAVTFRRFPVAHTPPMPLKSSNVLVVKGANIEPITDIDELETFIKENLKSVKDDAGRKAAAVTWVRLSQELHQDGMLTFRIPANEVTCTAKSASAKSIVEPKSGNQGQISVTLTFSEGKVIKVEEKSTVKAGVRPVCQATKLLDPDLIVQKMAEKDILVMGRSCKAYLDEQHTKASPELKQAIDRIWQQILEEDR